MSLSMSIEKTFPGFRLAVDLEAGEERVALLGASGCGKSCTLRCIAGVETPDRGRIVVNGTVFFDSEAGIDLSPQQRACTLLFQNYRLFPHLSVVQNVEAGMRGAARARREDALQLLSIFGARDLADRYPAQLSGGQQQRVALARMLAARPGIYMLDEPLSALDSYLKSSLEQNLLDIFSVVGRTVLYVSHDIDEACRLCDRIAVMHEGRIVELGGADELMRHPRTLAALRLTGCKNTCRIERVGPARVRALDWGMTFEVGRPVPDDARYLGIRASYIEAAGPGESGGNVFELRVARVSDSRFERLVLLDTPRTDSASCLQWKIHKVGRGESELPRAGEVLRVRIDPEAIHLVGD